MNQLGIEVHAPRFFLDAQNAMNPDAPQAIKVKMVATLGLMAMGALAASYAAIPATIALTIGAVIYTPATIAAAGLFASVHGISTVLSSIAAGSLSKFVLGSALVGVGAIALNNYKAFDVGILKERHLQDLSRKLHLN